MPDKPFRAYTIVMDLDSNAPSLVHGVDLYCGSARAAMAEDEAVIKAFSRFVKLPVSSDVCKIRLVKGLGTPDEKCVAKAERSQGFAVVLNPDD